MEETSTGLNIRYDLHYYYLSGSTRDIGSCLTRVVIRHRAMEARMKSLAG